MLLLVMHLMRIANLEALEEPSMEEDLQSYATIFNVDGHHVEHIFVVLF